MSTETLAARRIARYGPLLFLLLYAAWLCWKQSPLLFGGFSVPVTDFAADDILVVEAKKFQLLHGVYSRLGFYHPGPYLLYVAALGEMLFFDWTQAFSSYFAAQNFAGTLLQGIAFAFMLRLWLLVTGNAIAALLAVALCAATISWSGEPSVFINRWAAFSQVANATMLATGLAGMFLRGPRWLPLFVFGAVAMIHTHASFIGLTVIMAATSAIAAIIYRQLPFSVLRRREAVAYVRANPWPFLGAAVIAAVGAAPIAINTIAHWPGDVPLYFRAATLAQFNEPFETFRYLISFVPFFGLWLLAFPARHWLTNESEGQASVRMAGITVFLAGIVPATFFAVRGVDTFDPRYFLLWVTGFVGTAASAAFVYVLALSPGKTFRRLAFAAATALVVVPLARIPGGEPSGGVEMYLETSKTLDQRASSGRKIELGFPYGFEKTWPDVVAILAILNRMKSASTCVEKQAWVLLFHERFRCDSAASYEEFQFVPRDDAAATVIATLPSSMIVKRNEARPIIIGDSIASPFTALSLKGDWSIPESWGVWSDGANALIAFNARSLPDRFRLKLDGSLIAPRNLTQSVHLYDAAGLKLATLTGSPGDRSIVVDIDLTRQPDRNTSFVRLEIVHPLSPRWSSAEPRHLGFGLIRATFLPE